MFKAQAQSRSLPHTSSSYSILRCITYLPDGTLVLTASEESIVYIFCTHSGQRTRHFGCYPCPHLATSIVQTAFERESFQSYLAAFGADNVASPYKKIIASIHLYVLFVMSPSAFGTTVTPYSHKHRCRELMHMHTSAHICAHAHMHTYAHTCTPICTHVHAHICSLQLDDSCCIYICVSKHAPRCYVPQ